jgi:oligogalacturonide lyase
VHEVGTIRRFNPEAPAEPIVDRVTGACIRQITNHPSINHPTYFLQSSFLPDGRSLIFTSYRTGAAQLFQAEFPAGGIRQITDAAPIHPYSPAVDRSGTGVYFVRQGAIWHVLLASGLEREIVNFADGQLGECSLSADGEWLTAAIKRKGEQGIAAGRTDGTSWRIIPFPRTVIHPQFHPSDSEWILFAGDPAPRMFRVRRDGTGMECLHEHGNNEFIVHETFLGATGEIVFTVWPRLLCRMDWTTREIRTICEFNAWHIAANRAGTKVLCDTNHPDGGLFLIDVESGGRRHICMSDATNQGTHWRTSRYALAEDFAAARKDALSWMEMATDTVYGPQWTHPHPSFSRDEKRVAFASDRTGVTQVYVVDL